MKNRVFFFNAVLAIVCVLALTFCVQLVGTSSGETINSFDGSVNSKTINFYTRGDSTELSMTIPNGVPVTSASIDVSTADLGTGEFCEQPGIDFGPDNDLEWQFSGNGYGAFGKQYTFSTNNTRSTHTFTGAGSQSSTKIRMPKDAVVSSASMGINGRLNANTPSERLLGSYNYLHGPSVGNLNTDTYKDIVTPYYYYSSGQVFWWKSSGGTTPTYTRYTVDTGLRYPNDCDIGDLNGDGINDIACAAARYYTGYPSLMWYKNGGGATPSFAKTTLDSSLGGTDVAIGKIDSDGDNDMVFGTYYNGLFWYSNNGGSSPTFTKKTIDSSLSYVEQIDIGDVDGDGDNDVTVITYSWSGGGLFVYINNGNGNTWTKVQLDSSLKYGSDVQFADIDQDGDLDVVAAAYYDYSIKWYENIDATVDKGSGNGKNWNIYVITSSFYYAHGLFVTDIANDGYMDIFCTGYYGNQFYWFEAPDDPRTGSWTRFTVDSYLYYGWDCVVADMNNDAKPDVVATSYISGGLTMYDLSYSYPNNPSLQFGGTGTTDWSYSGLCSGEQQTGDITGKIQSLVDAGSPVTDSYGNQYVEFPIKVTLGSGGRLTLEDLEIRYNLTVTVDKNPHNNNLKTEVNELVPESGGGDTTIYMNVHSNSPGALSISGLDVEYNGFPTLKKNIPTFNINEDSVTDNLFDVREYFEDDYESADELSYVVQMSSSDLSKVRVTLVNDYFIKADCSQYPNWNGDVSVQISAKDKGELGQGLIGIRITKSNSFKIIVNPVNDPPTIGSEYLTNVQMNEGGVYTTQSLDDKKYFNDLEKNTLYYKGKIDPQNKFNGEELGVDIDEWNRIVITARNDFHGMKIPARIYCTDVENDWSNLDDLPYQDFTVTVKQLMDDKPKWGYIEDIYMEEDTDLPEAMLLTDHISSIDFPVAALQFSIVYNVNGSQIFADIDDDNYLNLYASDRDYDGCTDIAIRASDGYNYADTMVRAVINPVNDAPTGKIIEPVNNAQVELGARVMITGSANDPESIKEVEIRIGKTETWSKASGAGSWQYTWMVEDDAYDVAEKVQISMRVYDGEVYSPVYTTNVTVIPGSGLGHNDDFDGDGVPNKEDAFPENPFEWVDKDRDGYGDNAEDLFPEDPKEWADTDHDGEGDNSDDYPDGEDRIADTNDAYESAEKESSWFSLWWLVVLLIIVEAAFIVLLAVKKIRSKKPMPKSKVQKKKAEAGPYSEKKPEQ